MHVAGHPFDLMSAAELDLIRTNALRILAEMGLQVQDRSLLQVLADFGLPVDFQAERARFPADFVENFISEAEKYDWENLSPSVTASAGVYFSRYHDPLSGTLVPWTAESLVNYFGLARSLPNVASASLLGSRLPVPPQLEPLYERYDSWKYGAREAGSIGLDALCPYLLELYQARAAQQGRPLDEVFKGQVYLVPALKLARPEAYQVAYFRQRGLRVAIGGSMFSLGANAPATLAGAVALNLAEQLALGILDWALFGVKRLSLHSSIAVLDMRTTIRPFGRPEMAVANLMTAQLARALAASFSGHAGLSDAKLPSVESGAQKALTAIPTLLAGGSLWLDAGLLAIDEVCSPVQLVLDNEFLGALKRFIHEFRVDEASLGLETILEAGPGGQYLDAPHTARNFRAEHWNPGIWSRQALQPWLEAGGRLDADQARQVVLDTPAPELPVLPEAFEGEVRRIIQRAGQALVV